MLLFLRIRYLDSRDKQFKDRDLYLDTSTLEPTTRLAVEYIHETRQPASRRREILRFRHLFTEEPPSADERQAVRDAGGTVGTVFLGEYFEDENGQELSTRRMGQILAGDDDAVLFPSSYRPHDIELALAEKDSIDVSQIGLEQDEVDSLAYFARDLDELLGTEFFRNGPGVISSARDSLSLQTATTADEIRSFVTVFRKLYMTRGERGAFVRAAAIFCSVVDHPIARWVEGEVGQYTAELGAPPDHVPFLQDQAPSFTRKRLIDAFIYTKFAHQPQDKRIRQYQAMLHEVRSEELLTWLFLTTVHCAALHIANAGRQMRAFLRAYLQSHGATPSFRGSSVIDHAGVGALEKPEDMKARVFAEKAEQLALRLWQEAGRPESGPAEFLPQAREQLRRCLGE